MSDETQNGTLCTPESSADTILPSNEYFTVWGMQVTNFCKLVDTCELLVMKKSGDLRFMGH